MKSMHVEIWSDIACPWCFVGKRRFEKALAGFEHADEVTVTWRSFELDPGAPTERSGDRNEHLARKYGMSVKRAQEMHDHMTRVGAADGIEFRFGTSRMGNTFDAHRLTHLARQHGLHDAMNERLLRAHFTEGELISDHATLERLGVEVGVPADEVRAMLLTERFAEDVREDEATASALLITAVPFFAVDRRFGASGAQDPEVLLGLLRRAWEERTPLDTVTAGASCDADGC